MAQTIIQNFIGGSRQSDVSKVCEAYSLNMFPETQDGEQATSGRILRSIYGTSTFTDTGENWCRGLFRASRDQNSEPVLFGCFGSTIYLIEKNGVLHRIGDVANTSNTPVSMCETGGYGDAHPHLIVCDGISVFAVDTTLSFEGMVEDWRRLPLPLRAASEDTYIAPTHCAYLYNYLIVNDAGTDAVYLSEQYPFETFDEYGSLNYDVFQTAKYGGYGFAVYSEWATDKTLAIAGNGSFLYTFGDRSFQVFSHNNDVNFPFSSGDGCSSNIGIRAVNSIAVIGRNIFWLGASDIGQNGIFTAVGNETERISTPDIERQIAKMTYPEDAVGQAWQENQHVFYSITFITDKKTFVYDVNEKVWHNRESYERGLWRPQFACFAYNKLFFGLLDGGQLIYSDSSTFKEFDGLPIVRLRRGGFLYSNMSPMFCDAFRLVTNSGQLRPDQCDLVPQIMCRWSWNGDEWSDKEIGLYGRIGQYNTDVTWWHLGCGKFLVVEVSCSEDIEFTIVAAKIESEQTGLF